MASHVVRGKWSRSEVPVALSVLMHQFPDVTKIQIMFEPDGATAFSFGADGAAEKALLGLRSLFPSATVT